jgi:hypothetical protein
MLVPGLEELGYPDERRIAETSTFHYFTDVSFTDVFTVVSFTDVSFTDASFTVRKIPTEDN